MHCVPPFELWIKKVYILTLKYVHFILKCGYSASTAEIAMFENNVVVYKFVQDLHFFVTGGEDENELILATVLQGFFDAVGLLLRFFHNTCTSVLFLYTSIFCI